MFPSDDVIMLMVNDQAFEIVNYCLHLAIIYFNPISIPYYLERCLWEIFAVFYIQTHSNISGNLTISTFGFCLSLYPDGAHDNVIKWTHFPRYWPFMRGIHTSPVNSTHKGQWRGALMFCLICTWIKIWVNNREAGDLRRHRTHYDAIVMKPIQQLMLTDHL